MFGKQWLTTEQNAVIPLNTLMVIEEMKLVPPFQVDEALYAHPKHKELNGSAYMCFDNDDEYFYAAEFVKRKQGKFKSKATFAVNVGAAAKDEYS